jgi:hypothetical protein
MPTLSITRREFLASLGLLALCGASARYADSRSVQEADFELLVVGDSLIWGQGLDEDDKFYTLTRDWLADEVFGNDRRVNLTLKAHSGSTIKFHADEAAAFKKAGRLETHSVKPEINVSFPSIWKQVDVAAAEFEANGRSPDLVMLTGGVADITVPKLLDPFGDNAELPRLISRYCRDDMFDLLLHISDAFPRTLIAVIAYFPIISPHTRRSRLFNSWLEAMAVPRFAKSIISNPITRPMLDGIRRKGIKRSRIWFDESNRCFQEAVAKLNGIKGRRQAVFVPSPITERTCLETPASMLFGIEKKGRVNDPLYGHRVRECGEALRELKRSTGLKYSTRHCEIAAVGHPNKDGSRAYAEAIKTVLRQYIAHGRP